MRGLWKLTWIELKIFMREPLGAFGTVGVPVLIFIVLGPCGQSPLQHAPRGA
jgi:ABC-2 type transport system permease protein